MLVRIRILLQPQNLKDQSTSCDLDNLKLARPNIPQSKCVMMIKMRYGDTSTSWPQLIDVMVYETNNNANWDSRATVAECENNIKLPVYVFPLCIFLQNLRRVIDGHVICILQTVQAWLRWHITQPIKKSLCKIWMGNYLPYSPASGASLTDIIQRFSSTVDCGVPPNRMFKPRMQLILYYSVEIKVYYINNTHKCFSSII